MNGGQNGGAEISLLKSFEEMTKISDQHSTSLKLLKKQVDEDAASIIRGAGDGHSRVDVAEVKELLEEEPYFINIKILHMMIDELKSPPAAQKGMSRWPLGKQPNEVMVEINHEPAFRAPLDLTVLGDAINRIEHSDKIANAAIRPEAITDWKFYNQVGSTRRPI